MVFARALKFRIREKHYGMAEQPTSFAAGGAKGADTVFVRGDFTYERTGEFLSLIRKLAGGRGKAPKIRVDLADCPFVDSGCMGAMAQAQKELIARGGEMRVVNAQPQVLEAMRRIRLDAVLPVRGKKK